MPGPENLRRGIFPIRTPAKETVPVLPKPDLRGTAPPGSPESGKLPTKKPLIQRLVNNLALRIALAAAAIAEGTGAVITELTNDQPRSAQTIRADLAWPWNLTKSAVEDIKGMFSKDEVPPFFDNNADHQFLQAGINANPIASTELSSALKGSIKPLEEKSFPQVEMLLPVQLNPNERVEVSKRWVRSAFNPIAEKTDNLVFGRTITIPKEGTKIIVPVENAEVFQISPYVVNGQSYFNGVLVRFKGPDNTVYELAIETENEVTDLGAMDIIKKAPTIGKDGKYIGPIMHKDTLDLKGLVLPPGTPILISNKDNVVIAFYLDAYSPTYPKGLPSNFNLIQDQQGNGKILYLPATP